MDEPCIIVGKGANGELIALPGEEHVALHARTRAGKGVSFALPNCFAFPGSLIVLDVKGTAFKTTAGHRKAMGQDVYLFDPASRQRRSHRWNPFDAVERQSDERFEQILRLANLLYPEIQQVGTSSTGNNEFWEGTARQAFNAVATLLAETPGETLTVARVLEFFTQPNGHLSLKKMVEQAALNQTPYSLAVVNGLADYCGDDDNTKLRDDIRKGTSNKLQLWYDPKIVAATAASDFDLREIRRRPMTIYVVVQPRELQRLKPLLRLFWNAVINANTGVLPSEDPALKVPVLLMMDEFARMGRVDTLAQAPQYVAEYGLRMAFVVQSKAQIRAIYGPDASKDIFDNVGAEIIFGTTDPDLTKEIEERLGDNTIDVTTANRPRFFGSLKWNKQSVAVHPHRRQLMLDQEVAQMDPSRQIIIRAGMKPSLTWRVRWHDDPRFMHLVQPPPSIPKLNVVVPLGPVARVPTADEVEAAKEAEREAERQVLAEKASDMQRQVEEATLLAEQMAEIERDTADEARRKAAHAAMVTEQARLARAVATETARAARAADADDSARKRAEAAVATTQRLAADAADATEVARAAKSAATDAARSARSAAKRAAHLARVAATEGIGA